MRYTMKKPTALTEFMARKARIDALLDRLQAQSNDHFGADPYRLHWGHVGSLGRIEQLLEQALGDAE